jgi:hypothetical protein
MDAKPHNTSHLENKKRKVFQWGSGGREAEACTQPETVQIFRRVAISIMYSLNDFVGNLMACKLRFFTSAVLCRPFNIRLCNGLAV